jgi:hypothetical protein
MVEVFGSVYGMFDNAHSQARFVVRNYLLLLLLPETAF